MDFSHFCRVQGFKISICVKGRGLGIPHICHGHHGQCPCKFFLSSVNFSRMYAKIDTFLCNNFTLSVKYHSVCNTTQCKILYKVCNLCNMCDFTHLSVTHRCMVYSMCISFAEYIVFAPIQCYTAFTLSV